jgi:hypothetical protein
VAERLVHRNAGLAEDVALAEVVAVVGAHDDRGVVRSRVAVEGLEQPARTSASIIVSLPPYWARTWRASRGVSPLADAAAA